MKTYLPAAIHCAVTLCLSVAIYTATAQTVLENRVAVFKNGKSFHVQSLNAERVSGTTYQLRKLPKAAFGTLWLYAQDNAIKDIASTVVEAQDTQTVTDMMGLLRANKGQKLQLVLYSFGGNNEPKPVEAIIDDVRNDYVLTRINGQHQTLRFTEIRQVLFSKAPSNIVNSKKKDRVLTFTVSKAAGPTLPVQLSYLTGELGWMPSYQIELLDDKKARLVLTAHLINDGDTLRNTDVSFVVGDANFPYSNVPSPLTSQAKLRQILAPLGYDSPVASNQMAMGASRVRREMSSDESEDFAGEELGDYDGSQVVANYSGSTQEDLFYYTTTGVTINTDGRTLYTLVNADLPYVHIYKCKLMDNTNSPYSYVPIRPEAENVVDHELEIDNQTGTPLTSAPAFLVRYDKNQRWPLSQGAINYTPRGAKANLRVARARDVVVKHEEEVESRSEQFKAKNGYYYSTITVKATLKLKNFKDKAIDAKLLRHIRGKLLQSTLPWQTRKLPVVFDSYYTAEANNELNGVEWKVLLQPNEEKTFAYTYQLFIRQ